MVELSPKKEELTEANRKTQENARPDDEPEELYRVTTNNLQISII